MPSRASRSNTMLRSRRKSCAITAWVTSVNCARRGVDRALEHRAALGDEQHHVLVGDPLQAFDQQLGGDRVDEIGEQDDQRAALEPGIELGEAEREIGLLVMIVELGGGALDAREARMPRSGPRYCRTAASKPKVPTRSPPCSETQASIRAALIAWSSRVMPSTGSSIR